MHQLIDKMITSGEAKANAKEKKRLLRNLESIPLEKRQEVIQQLTKRLGEYSPTNFQSERSSRRDFIESPNKSF